MRTRGLTKFYGSMLGLGWVDLDVRRGEVFGCIGPDGGGKSTLLRMAVDLVRPSGGTIHVFGLDPRTESIAVRRRVGYAPPGTPIDPRRTAEQWLGHLARLRGGVEQGDLVTTAERFEIPLRTRLGRLPLEDQRAAVLVQAFMHHPELLLLDDAHVGLPASKRAVLFDLVAEARREGRTVVLAATRQEDLGPKVDRVGRFREGRLVKVGDLDTVRETALRKLVIHFAHPVRAGDFADVHGVKRVQTEGDTAYLTVQGSINPLVKHMGTFDVLDIETTETDVEDVFVRKGVREAEHGG